MLHSFCAPVCTSIGLHLTAFLRKAMPARPPPTHNVSTALTGTQPFVSKAARTGHEPFPKLVPHVLPMVRFAQHKHSGHGNHQYRFSLLQWTPGPARKNPTQILAAACGRFHAAILQEASDHAPRVSDQCSAYTGGTDLAILRGGWRPLVVRGLLRHPSLSGSPTVTFCSVHVHNVVAKKRDASTSLLRRLHAHMVQHNVDFISGELNMRAFSTVGDVFTDPEFAAHGNSLLWASAAWTTYVVNARVPHYARAPV